MAVVLPEIPLAIGIPRVIFQTYKSRDLPSELAENVERIRALNPEWDYRFFDDEQARQFILDEYGEAVVRQFDRINPLYGASRADLFRYLLIYRFGGVYLDIKSGVTHTLDDMILDGDRFILSHWRNGPESPRAGWGLHAELSHVRFGEYQQWHVIAAAGHPFLRAVILETLAAIRDYRPWVQGIRQAAVITTTGPIVYTRAIHPLLARHPHREVRSEEEIGLQYSFTPDYLHKRFFGSHYTQLWAPLIVRPGWRGMLDRGYARLVKARNTIAVKSFPFRQGLRSMARHRWKRAA